VTTGVRGDSPQTGHHAVLDQLIADGVSRIFDNPGTVEQGLLDALGDRPDLSYVLTLQESIAVYAADAYARATGGLAVAQIHSSPGLGNAIGAMYQAHRGQSPVLVLGGDAGIRFQAMDAQMAADLVAMAKPVTKWSVMVQHPTSLLRILRRAIKIALTPPMGPVYVCLPQDILDEYCTEEVFATSVPDTRVLPQPAAIEAAAMLLMQADRPTIYIGDGVSRSGAQSALAEVAELLGADVWGVDGGNLNMSYRHPMWRGQTGHMFGSHSLSITQSGDVNLVVGTYMLPEVFPELGGIYGPAAKTIHIDLDTDSIAKNHPVEFGLLGDPRITLEALASRLRSLMPADRHDRAAQTVSSAATARATEQERARESVTPGDGGSPGSLHFGHFMRELIEHLPPNALVFDEALTNSPALTAYLLPSEPGQFFQTRGGSLGTALAGGIGLQASAPHRTVVAVSGDGGGMYVLQSLWSAVRHALPVKFVICNNRSYRLLQANITQFWAERDIVGRAFPLSFDLSKPALNFADLARGFGMESARIETQDQIAPAILQALANQGQFLLDVMLDGDVHPELIGVRCGQ
jgi:thiamine pyrophosphate-dependent acetolactate synthase large subunit-like protein